MHFQQIDPLRTRDGAEIAPAINAAAALRACGFPVRFKVMEAVRTGSREPVWQIIGANVHEANELLVRTQIPDGPESLSVRAPEHPFLAALAAIASLETLAHWMAHPHSPPAAVRVNAGRLLVLQPAAPAELDLVRAVWADMATPAPHDIHVTSNDEGLFLAAAAVCGFLPRPQLTADAGRPTVGLPAESLTFPGLRLEDFSTAPAGAIVQHPFAHAVLACHRWIQCQREEHEERQRTLMQRSRVNGQKTAFFSETLFDSDPTVRDAVRDFLAAA